MSEQMQKMRAAETARYMRMATSTLAHLRSRGGGPKFCNFGKPGRGRCIRYRLADVLAWADSRAVASTSEYKPAV